jgi:hypothetical protein
MALLVDKHRPRSLNALSYHPELSDRLQALVSSPEANRDFGVVMLICMIWFLGSERRLPTSTHLWTFWRGQEDEDLGDAEGAVWTWC